MKKGVVAKSRLLVKWRYFSSHCVCRSVRRSIQSVRTGGIQFGRSEPAAEVCHDPNSRYGRIVCLIAVFNSAGQTSPDDDKTAVEATIRGYEEALQDYDYDKANSLVLRLAKWIEENSYPGSSLYFQ